MMHDEGKPYSHLIGEWRRQRIFRITVVIYGSLVCGLGIYNTDPVMFIMGVVYTFLMSRLLDIEPERFRESALNALKRHVFLWSSIPLIIGIISSTDLVDTDFFFVFIDMVYTTLAAIFAFMLVIYLNYYTDFRSDRRFTIYFIAMVTVGTGTLLGLTRYFSDVYLGTIYLGGNTHFMAYLIMTYVLAVSVASTMADYIRSYEFFPLKDIGMVSEPREGFQGHRREFIETLYALFPHDHVSLIWISRALQIGMFFTSIYGLYIDRLPVFYWSLFSLVVALSPDILGWNIKSRVPGVIYLWLSLVPFIFTVGRPLGFYGRFTMWAGFTHLLAGTLVGVLIYSLLAYVSLVYDNIHVPPGAAILIVLIAIFPIGVIWEISEFYLDVFFDQGFQAGLEDTVWDILCNSAGSVLSLPLISMIKRGSILDPFRT